MRIIDAETRFERARLTTEMIAIVEELLAERITRVEAHLWAEKLIYPPRAQAPVFHTGAASALLTCLLNLDYQLDGQPMVRSRELIEHVRALRVGDLPFDSDVLATLTCTPNEVAAMVSATVTRFCVDGLGWMESCQFASLATARRFVVNRPLEAHTPKHTSVHTYDCPKAAADRTAVLADLFDTLVIDMDEVTWSEIAAPERWRLLRSDDNGNTQLVRHFSGYAKARNVLAEYEAKRHKQAYWLEREA